MQVASSEIVKVVGVGVGVGVSEATVVTGADAGKLSAWPHAVIARIDVAATANKMVLILPQSKVYFVTAWKRAADARTAGDRPES
jgi:hypothetical protein